jgi:16S rRNA (guanine527-N7)-methyltransferase
VKHVARRAELAAFDVSRETEEKLEAFVAQLETWSPRLNLISRHDLAQVWSRHIVDSLQLVPLIQPGISHAIDLGSGAGFPGLILAIATSIQVHLVESDQRKAAFLREAARITTAPVTIHAIRIESLQLPRAPLITARALAPLARLLPLVAPLIAENGECLLLKGARAQAELDEAQQHWHMVVDRHESRTSPDATILRIRDLRHV